MSVKPKFKVGDLVVEKVYSPTSNYKPQFAVVIGVEYTTRSQRWLIKILSPEKSEPIFDYEEDWQLASRKGVRRQ